MSQFCVDANIFITAWHSSYPIKIFRSLWPKLAESKGEIVIIKPIFDEIDPISSADNKLTLVKKKEKYPLRMWLVENQFLEIPVGNNIDPVSLDLEKEYEISDISKGAGQNDITLIAYAKTMNKTVVTFEEEQPQTPNKKCNYKIPLICSEQNVKCIDFVTMLDNLNIQI